MKSAALGMMLIAILGGGSYLRLPALQEARLLKTRGESHLGKRIHLHVSPRTFAAKPRKVRPFRRGPIYHAYRYRGMTLLVRANNPYYRQMFRKRGKASYVCVKGRVMRFSKPLGTVLLVHRVRASRGSRRL